jgi:hypothetical protein
MTHKTTGDPIAARAADDEGRSAAAEQLERIAGQYAALADSSAPSHAHLEAAERDTLRKEAGAALEWLRDKLALQAQVCLVCLVCVCCVCVLCGYV